MKKLLLKTMLLLCALVVGSNAWATDETIEIKYSNFSNTSYNTSENTFSQSGITFGYVNAMKNGSNGTPTGWASNQVIQTKSGGTIYNKTAISGLKNIRVYIVANTNSFTVTSGTTSQPTSNSVTRPSTPTGTESITYSKYENKTVTSGQSTTANYYDFAVNNDYFMIAPGGSLYIWKIVLTYSTGSGPVTYSVYYDGNGANSGTAPTDETAYSSGATVTVLGNTGSLVKTGYAFGGWNTENNGTGTNYTAGNTFSITANTTLYAKWTFAVTDGIFDFVNAAKEVPLVDYGSGMTLTSSEYTTGNKTWKAVNVTMVTSDGGGDGIRWWSADGTLRFYNKATATFSVPSGYVITKIVTTGANFNNANVGTLSGTTWTGASNSVELSVNATRNIKTITVTYTTANQSFTPAKTYTTLTSAYALDFTDISGLKAYIATEISAGKVQMTQVNKVPAGTGLVLKATTPNSPVNVPVFDGTSADDVSGNKMAGSATETTVIAENGGYILSNGVFQPASAGTLAAGKAYLNIAVPAGAHELTMVFDGDETDGLKTLSNSPLKSENIYNLAGQRLQKMQRGINIVNGRKVVNK